MKTDVNGCSTTKPGQEQYEYYYRDGKRFIQYDYRLADGRLYSCCCKTLPFARARRDEWLKKLNVSK